MREGQSRRSSKTLERSPAHLSSRKLEILGAIVNTFLQSYEPVASRTVQKRLGSSLSTATIRNEMADLEEEGFLEQPHRSAGRIPTPKAIRYWIKERVVPEDPPDSLQRELGLMTQREKDPHTLIEDVGEWLANRLDGVVLLTYPRVLNLRLKRAELFLLDEQRILLIWITTGGVVLHRVFALPKELPDLKDPTLLPHLEALLNERFQGMQLEEIRRCLAFELRHLERRVFELVQNLLEKLYSSPEEVVLKGALKLTAVRHPQALGDIGLALKELEDRRNLLKLVDKLREGKGVKVLLNEETGLHSEGISIVGSPYGSSSGTLGALGVVGPLYMSYPRVIGLVRYTTRILSQALPSR